MRDFTLAIIESRECRDAAGLSTDPFLPDFRLDDLLTASTARLSQLEALAAKAARAGAELVVMTEDITRVGRAGTFLEDPGIFRAVVEHQSHVVPRRLAAAAARWGIHLAASFYAAEGSLIHNVADLFGPDGSTIGRYRKVHLPAYEQWMVSPGTCFPVFETELGRIGLLICYDQNSPEAFAALSLGGAEIVLHPSAAPLREYRMVCRSVDHHVYYASACPRGSMITAPTEEVIARSTGRDPEIIAGAIDGSLLDFGDERYYDALYSGIRSHRARELRHRRPETYGLLVAKDPPVLETASVPQLPSAELIREIYERHRDAILAAARGSPAPYHWEYWRGAAHDQSVLRQRIDDAVRRDG